MASHMAPAKAGVISQDDPTFLALGLIGVVMVLPVIIVGGAIVMGLAHAIDGATDGVNDDSAKENDKSQATD